MSSAAPKPHNERNDPHDQFTKTQEEYPPRQQSQTGPAEIPDYTSQSPESARTLRRTPHLSQSLRSQPSSPPRLTHIEATSVGLHLPSRGRAEDKRPEQTPRHQETSSASSYNPPARFSSLPHADSVLPQPRLRISKRTASAILYALEEALRHPNAFTPDLLEENASMSDLRGGSIDLGRGSNVTGNGLTTRPPRGTGSPGVRTPIEIMRAREAREARKKAEQEALDLEKARADEEQRRMEEMRRKATGNQGTAGGGPRTSGGEAGYRSSGSANPPGQRASDSSQRSDRRSGGNAGDANLVGRGTGTALGGGEAVSSAGVRQSQRQTVGAQGRAGRSSGADAQPAMPPPEAAPPETDPSSRRATNNSSFPHAFERWETLSAHWEGLTSFWMRRLEANAEEITNSSLNQQLSRQVTDLSAAGANLFHAVVELQRLRASSERKFQRWFFETRQEQERAREMTSQLEKQLQLEREARTESIQAAVAQQLASGGLNDAQVQELRKQVAEMKRELLISKEEARRAWEELGRREQEERERTVSLREGQPTSIGGVQVVPMMQGAPARNTSSAPRPQTRDGPYRGGPTATQLGGQEVMEDPEQAYTSHGDSSDPFMESSRGQTSISTPATQYSTAPTSQAQAVYYRQQGGSRQQPMGEAVSQEVSPDVEYEIDPSGEFRLDSTGHKIPYGGGAVSDDGSEEYEDHPLKQESRPYRAGTAVATSAYEPSTGAVDYTGQGYGGSGPGWEAIPRHHHPTRLSDVLEENEDERSRTSASQMSRRD